MSKKDALNIPKDPKEFTLQFIRANREERAGIHSVYSGYNEAVRLCFPDTDPITLTNEMVKEGSLVECNNPKFAGSPILVKGGAYLVIVGEEGQTKKKSNTPKISKKGAMAMVKAFGKTDADTKGSKENEVKKS